MEAMLEDNGLKEFIDQDIPKPPKSDEKYLDKWKKCVCYETSSRKDRKDRSTP